MREKRRGIGFETVAGMEGAIVETLFHRENSLVALYLDLYYVTNYYLHHKLNYRDNITYVPYQVASRG